MTATREGESAETRPAAFGIRIALVYSAVFFYVGILLPYFPLWLESKGLDATRIAIVIALPQIVRVLSSAPVTAYSDRAADRVNVVIALSFFAALLTLAYAFVEGFPAILLVTALLAFFHQPIVPVLESLALSGVRRFGMDYGRVRLWGSIVFILANIGGGIMLADADIGSVLNILIAGAFACALLSIGLPRIGRPRSVADPNVLAGTSAWRLLANRRFMLVISAFALTQASHAMIYGFGSIYWEKQGFSGGAIGAFWAIGVVAEILLFQYSGTVSRRIPPSALIAAGSAAAVLRWLLMPLDLGMGETLALQLLHGLTFGATHLGFIFFVAEFVPEERTGAAQGVGFIVSGVAMGVAALASGPLYGAFGVGAFAAMSGLGAAALVLLAFARCADQPQSRREGGDTIDAE